jgi:hypothetical protein
VSQWGGRFGRVAQMKVTRAKGDQRTIFRTRGDLRILSEKTARDRRVLSVPRKINAPYTAKADLKPPSSGRQFIGQINVGNHRPLAVKHDKIPDVTHHYQIETLVDVVACGRYKHPRRSAPLHRTLQEAARPSRHRLRGCQRLPERACPAASTPIRKNGARGGSRTDDGVEDAQAVDSTTGKKPQIP